ncbi:MAG: helix-hairpin-helix domain-containing protein [Candidatus Promineifilaceae bacterium]
MSTKRPTNEEIADLLEEIADLLEAKSANRFRVQAYLAGADTMRRTEKSVAKLAENSGVEALQALPDIGEGIAGVIQDYVRDGRSDILDRLQNETSPGELFEQVPGIGSTLAGRIVRELDISTLQELEQAAHDGRLLEVEGFDPKKVHNIQVSLAGMLSTAAQRSRRHAGQKAQSGSQPEVEVILELDEEYRRKAESGRLRKIAPKRFNPDGKAWLPILKTERGGWSFTLLYSNTTQAHKLDKTNDWVVVYYERDGKEEQATVVTESKGPLEGKRVVRGREAESQSYYQEHG